MTRWVLRLAASLVLAVVLVRPTAGQVTADDVREAIGRGVGYLKGQQQPSGAWAEVPQYPGGVTSLCTLALLLSGVAPDDPVVERAINYLRGIPPEKTYVVALQTMVFCRAHPDRDRPLIERNARWLEQQQIRDDLETTGAWGYPTRKGDNSNTQFAILALSEAERAGVKVNPQTWRMAKAYWERVQNSDGSWGYRKGLYGTGSMTAAGIASLVITSNQVREADARVSDGRIQCCTRANSTDDRVQRALQWLGANFAVSSNPGTPAAWKLYYLYGVERVGRLTAVRFIGKHDWYRTGAAHLVSEKGGVDDHWMGIGPYEGDDPRIATAFALMFLSKGRWPILIGKLKHSGGWDAHRSDVANLTYHVERQWRQDMVWQTVDLDTAGVEDLLEVPVLYLCGRDDPLPHDELRREETARKLRDYLDRGGFLLAEGCCGSSQFDEAFRRLIQRVFPEPEYRLLPLPPEHPIWRAEQQVDSRHWRPLWGVEFGCRTSVIYCPPETAGRMRPSLSCLWELSRAGRDEQYPEEVQAQIDAALAIGINILAYATGRQLRFKDPGVRGPVTPQQRPPSRFVVRLANLRHPGGCSAAPRALTELAETAARELHLPAEAELEDLDILDPALFDYPIVFMHGRNAFRLTDSEHRQLRAYVERGGTIVADAICGNRSFGESFRREMAEVFPDRPLEPVAGDHPLFTAAFGGWDIRQVSRREPLDASSTSSENTVRQVAPELQAIQIDGRLGVLFSPHDLSCALEKHDSLECRGYLRQDAARIALNVLLYCLQR